MNNTEIRATLGHKTQNEEKKNAKTNKAKQKTTKNNTER